MTSQYQLELQDLLQRSSLTPGQTRPSEELKAGFHAGVTAGEIPVILTGPANDKDSVEMAMALARSPAFERVMRAAGYTGPILPEAIAGISIKWPSVVSAVLPSRPGEIEVGGEEEDLTIMLLDLTHHAGVTTMLCVTTELARIIDPLAPELDDGFRLPKLSRKANFLDFH